MKGLAITHKGFEDICAKEINELVKTKTKVLEGCVEFEIEKLEDLCLIAYKAQSIIKILYYIDSCEYSEIEDLKKLTDKIDFDQWFNEETTFVVRCKRMDDTDESTQYIESQMGEYILEKKKLKVELKQPDVTFFVYICESKAYFGIDMTATELSKRQYKIYLHPEALKGTMGYCLYRMSDAKVGDVILDPFCGSGTILIETALHQTQFPVNYFNKQKFAFLKFKPLKEVDFDKFFTEIDKQAKENKKITLNGFDHQLRYVTSSKNNAKIAGIEKNINFARADAEWLDTKMEEEQVAVWPCILSVQNVYKKREPLIFSVKVMEGTLYLNTPLATKKDDIGLVTSIKDSDDQYVKEAEAGDIVTLKVEGENVMFGRHVFEKSVLYSKISRESLDYLKANCRDQIDSDCLKLLMQIKKVFNL